MVENKNALAGVSIDTSGPVNASVTTDARCHFSIAVLTDGGYTLTPAKPGYTFTSANRTFNKAGFSQTGQDLTATLLETPVTISGRVFLTGGRVNRTALVKLTDSIGNMRYTRINPYGVYRFVDLHRAETYSITVIQSGNLTYAPRTVTPFENALNVDFTPSP